MAEDDSVAGGLSRQTDLLIGGFIPFPDGSIGKLRSLAWVCLVMAGIVMIAFSAYMAAASVEQRHRIAQLNEQTRMLREALKYDHDSQVVHNRIMVDLTNSIRDAADRNKALIVIAIKKFYGWSDLEIDEAIRQELETARHREAIPVPPRLGTPADMGVHP